MSSDETFTRYTALAFLKRETEGRVHSLLVCMTAYLASLFFQNEMVFITVCCALFGFNMSRKYLMSKEMTKLEKENDW